MKNCVILLLIIFSFVCGMKAQQLYPDSVLESQYVPMCVHQDSSSDSTSLAIVDTLSPDVRWLAYEDNPFRDYIPYWPVICGTTHYTVTITAIETIIPPKTECALGVVAAESPQPAKKPDIKNSARAAQYFEDLATVLN